MSRFFSDKYAALTPYTPGEQPQDMQYTKLNTNESPFPPSEKALAYAAANTRALNLYSDPESRLLTQKLADTYGVAFDEVLATNGSDEILNFAFMAFCDGEHPAVFPDVTYGFYPVIASLNNVPYEEIPLRDDLTVNADDYCGIGKTIFLANPNAPTGIPLPVSEIERIVASNPDSVVVVDEAYVDFGGESCIPLIHKYGNLLVTQTFSKARSMAGGRLGYGIGSAALIADLNTIKYSTNPYNVNSLTTAVAIGLLDDPAYTEANCRTIMANRAYTVDALAKLGFETVPSAANFIFTRCPNMEGGALYRALKERGVLVRHWDKPRIADYLRITIGTKAQMDVLLNTLKDILGGC